MVESSNHRFLPFCVGLTVEENYGAVESEGDRPNGPIGMPILRVWGLWAYAHKNETKEQRYLESEVQRRPCSKAKRVAADRELTPSLR